MEDSTTNKEVAFLSTGICSFLAFSSSGICYFLNFSSYCEASIKSTINCWGLYIL